MAVKREKLEIVHDILTTIRDNLNNIPTTKLLSKSNLSHKLFKDYIEDLTKNTLIEEKVSKKGSKSYSLTFKGYDFIEKYKEYLEFKESFGF